MKDLLITSPCLSDYFLTLSVIVLSKSQFSQLVSYVHNLRGCFVLCMVKKDIQSFCEILFASLINLSTSLSVVWNGGLWFLVDEFFVWISEFL